MPTFHIHMFGKFRVQCDGKVLAGLEAGKLQDLFGYLLINRGRAHPREALAVNLWADNDTHHAKKHLRQTLWELQTALDAGSSSGHPQIILADPDWIQLNPNVSLWIDIAAFEQAYCLLTASSHRFFDETYFPTLYAAAELYTGQLMETCYQDWCLFERERLHGMYVTLVDRLIEICEARQEYPAALALCTQVLRYDRARERTHRQLMRLYYLAGDRSAALRQYHRCIAILKVELDVEPAQKTTTLYERIRLDQEDRILSANSGSSRRPPASTSALGEAISHLRAFATALSRLESGLLHHIEALEKSQRE